ncbi:MAG TPA: ATP synthase F1 subunit gamma, partial [Phycisphaerales bacterium]|nr:ATP synthase F1 subunit gamma [Phycisphaerales bacterium]
MANARHLRKRIKAVGNIRRITKTMQMIATSRFAKAMQKATATKPYVEGIFALVNQLAATAGNISHPLIAGPSGGARGKPLILVITSDRGLCGPYNGAILRTLTRLIREELGNTEYELDIVGRKGLAFVRFTKLPLHQHHTQFGDNPKFEDVEQLAQSYMDRFSKGEISSVRVISMKFISTARQRAETMQLLPLKPPAAKKGEATEAEPASGFRADYEFTPDPETILNDLLPVTVKATLFQAFNEAIVSEHVARMVAMKSATDNAGKMGKNLQRRFNRARQSQIT